MSTEKNGDANGEEEYEEAHLLVAVAHGGTKGAEPDRMPRKLEDPEDAHQPQDLHHLSDVLQVLALLLAAFLVNRLEGQS